MTPLGLNTAAVPEAAALFPLPAAAQAAADDGASTGTSFSDLLAASFGQPEAASTAAVGAAPSPKGVSIADAWFAGLTVDLNSLNAGLDAEETGAPAVAACSTVAPDEEAAAVPSGEDDEEAAAALLAQSVAMQVPVVPSESLPSAASAPADAPTNMISDAPLRSCAAPTESGTRAVAPTEQASSGESIETDATASQRTMGTASGAGGADDQAPVAIVARQQAAAKPQQVPPSAPSTAPANEASTPSGSPTSVQDAAVSVTDANTSGVGTIAASGVAAPAARPNLTGAVATTRAPGQPFEASSPEAVTSATQGSPVDQQLGKMIEAAPVQQPARETVVARVAETLGTGPGAGAEPISAANASQAGDSESQSQTEDGTAHEAFALGVQENSVIARSADGGSATPVFAVAPPVAPAMAPATVQAPDMPQGMAFAEVPAPENVGRLVESMRVQLKDGIQEATVRLNPEHFGEVTISVRVERGAVSAIVRAETPAVQQWLEAQEEKLRSGLSDQGLFLERFYVHRDGSQERREQPRQQPQSTQRYRQQRNDPAVRFEVLV